MSVAVGVFLALAVLGVVTYADMDRDRALYPVVAMVVASYYTLFAILGGSMRVLVIESAVALVFVALALAGFRSTLWLVAAALAGHGIFDLLHPRLYANPGLPPWWPPFCAAFDVVAAAWLAWRLASRKVRASAG